MTCATCGAMVGNEAKHRAWHHSLDHVEATAEEAFDKAEDAQNTLYQNNIST